MKDLGLFIRVYVAMILDNILLTVVVPILPDFIYNSKKEVKLLDLSRHEALSRENGWIGFLFASKSLIQLMTNFIVGKLTTRVGFRLPFTIGSCFLFLSSLSIKIRQTNKLIVFLVYTSSSTYIWLFIARSVHGLGSSCLCVSGIGMIASNYSDDEERSRAIGHTMGGVAVGILIGYPMGGMLYYFGQGKFLPFLIISTASLLFASVQILIFFRESQKYVPFAYSETQFEAETSVLEFLRNKNVLIIAGAIWIATSSVGILEPCLPLWIMDTMHPLKWQLGMTFVSDSIGYLIGTHFLAGISYKIGRKRVGIGAICLVGVGAIFVPHAQTLISLTVPQFILGLGIGLIDSSMLPLLARVIDDGGQGGAYGVVYAIAETAIAFAYGISPLLGSLSVELFGFTRVLTFIGLLNILYGPFLLLLKDKNNRKESEFLKCEETELVNLR